MSDAIEIRDIHYRREGTQVFSGLSLTLSERRVALVGRNGSGKSTLLRLAAGLLAPQSGRVTVAGVDVGRDRRRALDTVGILFQNPDHQIIFPTVLEQQGLSRAAARERARAALSAHPDWAERLCHTLSQGQRQMVCLLAILAMEPRWILFDEPFNSLDLPATLRIEARIAALGQNVLTVTHDPLRVAGYDRVIWLEAGQVAADGPPAEVLPAYTAAMERIAREDAC
jgi:biotin transport system ATP-binding protein